MAPPPPSSMMIPAPPGLHNPRHQTTSVAKDAEFLQSVDQSAVDLHRNNLLRIQSEQLVEETTLGEIERCSWWKIAQDYMASVTQLVETIDLSKIDYDPQSPFRRRADKNINVISSVRSLVVVEPAWRKTAATAATVGLTKPSGNANVLPTLDLIVMLPHDLFESKDYLRHRYFDKRNMIVWHVAQHLGQKRHRNLIGRVYYRCLNDDRTPVVLLLPPIEENDTDVKKTKKQHKKKHKTGDAIRLKRLSFRVQLHFGMESLEWIPPLRLVPNRCNLKADNFVESSQMYNHLLTADAHHVCLDVATIIASSDYPHLNAAVILAKIWCLQRGLLRNHDGLDTMHLVLLILYLFRTKQINSRMAPLQVLAALFKLLSQTDWLGEGTAGDLSGDKDSLNLSRQAPSEGYQAARKSFRRTVLVLPLEGHTVAQTIDASEVARTYLQHTKESPLSPHDPATLVELYSQQYTLGPVLLDPTMAHNYLGRVSSAFMRNLALEASRGLECMHSSQFFKPYTYLFMSEARFWSRCDIYMQISLSDIQFGRSKLWGHDRFDLGDYESISRGVVKVFENALGDRIQSMQLLSTGNGEILPTLHATQDADEFLSHRTDAAVGKAAGISLQAPTGRDSVVVGLTLNSATCARIVDRGPPADDLVAVQSFLDLWGSKAALRRFKDGAIVHAVIWTDDDMPAEGDSLVHFQNGAVMQGGIVERIVRHILSVHFLKPKFTSSPEVALRGMLSCVAGVVRQKASRELISFNSLTAHQKAMRAFESLSDFLRKHSAPTLPIEGTTELKSRLGIPLTIDAVEPLAPALRYAELFPPVPHPLLGAENDIGIKKATGAITSSPIKMQLRFGSSSKWPTNLNAIGAAKTAMLLQLTSGIEEMKQRKIADAQRFEGKVLVTPAYADVGYLGYVFRIFIRVDQELKYLRNLRSPSPQALQLSVALTRVHVIASLHHSSVHAVYTSHPSSSTVVRMAKFWVSTHMMSGLIPFEAIEIMVAHVYSAESCPTGVPASTTAGFIRWLRLLANHDFEREPLIADPQNQLTEDDYGQIVAQFDHVRGAEYKHGAPMYLATPYDREDRDDDDDAGFKEDWAPAYTHKNPEWVVLNRAIVLAKRSYDFLREGLKKSTGAKWPAVFHESAESFRSFSALLRVDPDLVMDPDLSSSAGSLVEERDKNNLHESTYTRCMRRRYHGPKDIQIRLYKNLLDTSDHEILLEWRPIDELVGELRAKLGSQALFFYNDLCPEVIAVLWRPIFAPRSFSALTSEYARPVTDCKWKADTLCVVNVHDIMAEMSQYTACLTVGAKVFDYGPILEPSKSLKRSADDEVSAIGSSSDSF